MNNKEIRDSQVRDLLDKVRKRNYGYYLRSAFLKRIRHFEGATINFDFPVTALVGPNGSGKSTVLAAAACAYSTAIPKEYFFNSMVGDPQDFSWEMEYELVQRALSANDAVRVYVKMTREALVREPQADRPIKYFAIHRTLPPVTSPSFMRKYFSGRSDKVVRTHTEVDSELVRREASRILGKELSSFKLLDVSFVLEKMVRQKSKQIVFDPVLGREVVVKHRSKGLAPVKRNQYLFVADGEQKYSEFNFGAGEASVLRLVHGIEQSLSSRLSLLKRSKMVFTPWR
jgi:hypothetical protein